MSTKETYPDWITSALDNFTVAEAEGSERCGTSWPISGDATTIEQSIHGRKF